MRCFVVLKEIVIVAYPDLFVLSTSGNKFAVRTKAH